MNKVKGEIRFKDGGIPVPKSKPNTWNSLSQKDKKTFGSEENFNAFKRSLKSGQYDREEEESMGIKNPKDTEKSGINIKAGGAIFRVTRSGQMKVNK